MLYNPNSFFIVFLMRKALVAANWKMNGSLQANQVWLDSFLPRTAELQCDALVCAPAVYLASLCAAKGSSSLMVGAEDVNENEKGAFTGEVSARMLADIGVEWVIIGHSERRAMFGDSDERVGAKCRAAVGAGLRILPCVGETLQEREQGRTLEVVCRQLNAVLDAVGPEALAQGALAYEPVWAIGTGRTATPEQAQQVHAALRACVAKRSAAAAANVRILYGGSVKPANARELFGMADIDGGLVGGAALKADDFYSICAAVSA